MDRCRVFRIADTIAVAGTQAGNSSADGAKT
jgi:hypothetical protein